MNNEALIEEIREMHGRQERREGEPPMCLSCSPADWPCDAVRAADALEAATRCSCPTGDGSLRWPCPKHPPTPARVPVRGEPNGDREVLEHIRTTRARQRFLPNDDREALADRLARALDENDGDDLGLAQGEGALHLALDIPIREAIEDVYADCGDSTPGVLSTNIAQRLAYLLPPALLTAFPARAAVPDAATEALLQTERRDVLRFEDMAVDAMAERDTALAAVERVRAIHEPITHPQFPGDKVYCRGCAVAGRGVKLWPCETRNALNGGGSNE